MTRVLFLTFLLCFASFARAQSFDNSWVVRKTLDIPKSQTNTTADIASYIKANFKTDKEKACASYTWVTANIRFSSDSANALNLGGNEEAKITVALRRRKGVCENFAAIFNNIALKSGLTSFVVTGYTKQGGFVDKTGHSWCAALIDKDWQLFDPTWDEGREMNPKYFMMPPSEFIDTHMAYDPLWQLLNYPISNKQFCGNGYKKRDTPLFNYSDSIRAYMQMDSLHKFLSSAERMQKNDLNNELVKDNYNVIKMNIETINQDKDVDLYNSSVADLNDATNILNNFIQYRNNKFIPEKLDSELQELLEGIDSGLRLSIKKLDEIDRSEAIFRIGTDHVRDRINALLIRTKEQKVFVDQYTSTARNLRPSLFFK